MDLNYSLDDADLSVGLSVTCSTTTDYSYYKNGSNELHQEVVSSYSPFMINHTTENILPSNNESGIHIPDFNLSQSFAQSELGSSFNHFENSKSDEGDSVSFESSYEFKKNKFVTSRIKKIRNPKSGIKAHILSKNENSEAHTMQVCKTCGKNFKYQTSLLRHNNKVHFSRYQCSACCRVFSRQSYLDVHTSKPGTSCFIRHKTKSKKRKRKQ